MNRTLAFALSLVLASASAAATSAATASSAAPSGPPGIGPETLRGAQMEAILKLDDAGYDKQFRCPETLPDKDAKTWEIGLYMYWIADKHRAWSEDQARAFRHALLVKHRCQLSADLFLQHSPAKTSTP